MEMMLDGVPIRGEIDTKSITRLVGFKILSIPLMMVAEASEGLEHLVAVIRELDGVTLLISGGFDEIGVDFEENGVMLTAEIRDGFGHGGEKWLVGEIDNKTARSIKITEAERKSFLKKKSRGEEIALGILEAEIIRGEVFFGGGEFTPVGGLEKMGFLGVSLDELIECRGVQRNKGSFVQFGLLARGGFGDLARFSCFVGFS